MLYGIVAEKFSRLLVPNPSKKEELDKLYSYYNQQSLICYLTVKLFINILIKKMFYVTHLNDEV